MPGFDGTGPLGAGPMTGRGMGMCVIRLPETPGEPVSGIAGLSGRPVGQGPERESELAWLRAEAQRIEAILRGIYSRIGRLEERQKTLEYNA